MEQSSPVVENQVPAGKSPKKEMLVTVVVAILVVILGIGTGYLLTTRQGNGGSGAGGVAVKEESEDAMADEATFRDSAEGILKDGGISGEGTHHLERDGGPSQYVYLTSTVIDLSSFIDKKVQVWGETISARKAGWLMDVGKVKVIN